MSTGARLAGLLLITTSLSFPSMVQAQQSSPSPETEDPLIDDVQGTSQEEVQKEPEISVPGGGIIVTGRRNRDPVRNSGQVLNLLSAEDIARTGDGDIAGALTRVTGLSLVGDGRVFVRGLGDRYSLALLNGLPLPSPEPLSRVVPLDIFPTGVIASSLVQKTYSANFPGEFGGGVINLTTRAVPTEDFLTISFSASGDTETTFENGLTFFGSEFDTFGFDNGNRDIPSNLQAFFDSGLQITDLPLAATVDNAGTLTRESIAGQLLPTNLVTLQQNNSLPANFSGNISAGTSIELGDDTFLGIIATAGIDNSWRNRSVQTQNASIGDLSSVTEDFTNFITDNKVLVNGLLSFGLDFGENTIRFTNLYIRDFLKTARLAEGNDSTRGDAALGADLLIQRTATFERQLIDSQIVGEFEFGDGNFELDTRLGYARTDREAPFNTEITFARSNESNSALPADAPVNVLGSSFVAFFDGDGEFFEQSISFDDLQEENYSAGIDLTYQGIDGVSLTVGYAYTDTDRTSSSRIFSPIISPDTTSTVDFPPALLGLRLPGDIINGATIAAFNVDVLDFVQFPVFDAGLEIHGAYGQLKWIPTDTLNLEAGLRWETSEQTVELDQSIFVEPITADPVFTNIDEDNFLPTATATWEPIDDLQFRLSASRTIARPQFRELITQTFFDPESNREFTGNNFLVDSDLINIEGRAEYYLGGKDRVSVAGFFKDIDNPIEVFIVSQAGGDLSTTFANAPSATLFGAEFELVKAFELSGLGGTFFETKDLLIIANYTFTNSEISVNGDETVLTSQFGEVPATAVFNDGDPLVGQSDHIANVQIGFEDIEKTQQAFFLFNFASERVTTRGFSVDPDIVENPGLSVDFVARQELSTFGIPVEFSFEVRNIFGRDNFEFQENETGRVEINTFDVGTSFSLGLKADF